MKAAERTRRGVRRTTVRLGFVLPLLACALAHADASISAPSPTSLPLHALRPTDARGRAMRVGSGGAFLDVRDRLTNVVPRHHGYHQLAIQTSRGWFVDDLADTLFDDDASRSRSLVGPM